ncbi:hypothetical protein [Streptomyces sp. NRRL S-87]|uniref:hypothetical protein n=1 Tax=Streptomyces sp. NRRL S-87 TaxID=1463920 RepID=UPI00068B8DC7|nr:hypothetical protein [Streptomyces sp. NRRL S-87]
MPAPLLPSPRTAPRWSDLLTPDTVCQTRWASCTRQPELVACGTAWDAVVIAPLERGLAGLDRLGLPPGAGYPIVADYVRLHLIVLVRSGTGDRCDIPGTRVLREGTWLLVPADDHGTAAATWLSPPHPHAPLLVDADRLREALLHPDSSLAAR